MIQAALLLGCVLLSSVAAFPRTTQNGVLTLQQAITATEPASNVRSGKIPPPAPGTCQDLLYAVPSLAPFPEYLSLLALRVALEDIGCPAEVRSLQLQLSRAGGKDNTETLVLETQKRTKEEEIGNNKAILRGPGGSPGELKRARRSVTLPETCTSGEGQVFYELGSLLVEFAEKLPSIDVVREFKASAVNVTQKCTIESQAAKFLPGFEVFLPPGFCGSFCDLKMDFARTCSPCQGLLPVPQLILFPRILRLKASESSPLRVSVELP